MSGYNDIPINRRIYLDVTYEEKDEAKELGARWDPDYRSWYCIESVYSQDNVSKCIERWGEKAYTISEKKGSIEMRDYIRPDKRNPMPGKANKKR